MSTEEGPHLGQVHSRFFNTNETSHTWPLGAIAELIDNSYDPGVQAKRLSIDVIEKEGKFYLTFTDDGAGMDKEGLTELLRNGFKSSSMRLGNDVLVITRCRNSASIGFLHQTCFNGDTIQVPIVHYKLPQVQRIGGSESKEHLDTILQYSPFEREDELKNEIRALKTSFTAITGTKIIIYNLKMLRNGLYELDFSSDPKDIRCPETQLNDQTNQVTRPIGQCLPEYKHSLREYCSILYFHPRMKIVIRGTDVKAKFIARSLSQTKKYFYKPSVQQTTIGSNTGNDVDNNSPVFITFGYTCEEGKSKDYGMMLYHKNRLIKAYEKVGCQKKSGQGVDVIGVVEVDMLTPTHNKQDFVEDDNYKSVKAALTNKLKQYLKDVEEAQRVDGVYKKLPDRLWLHCDQCFKWRRLPSGTDKNSVSDLWYCHMNPDNSYNRCDIPEEPDQNVKKNAKRKSQQKKPSQESKDVVDLKLPSPVAAEKILIKQDKVSKATQNWGMISPSCFPPMPTQTAVKNILNKRLENMSAPNTDTASSLLNTVSTPTLVEKKITRKRKNFSNDPLQEPSTSSFRDNVVQQPKPKNAKCAGKKDSNAQEVSQSILTSIMKKIRQVLPSQSSTNEQPSAQISRAIDASIQTDILTSFHRNVHELLVKMTDTDPGNVEDIEAVVAGVLKEYRQ